MRLTHLTALADVCSRESIVCQIIRYVQSGVAPCVSLAGAFIYSFAFLRLSLSLLRTIRLHLLFHLSRFERKRRQETQHLLLGVYNYKLSSYSSLTLINIINNNNYNSNNSNNKSDLKLLHSHLRDSC